jgi:hypothetical protein
MNLRPSLAHFLICGSRVVLPWGVRREENPNPAMIRAPMKTHPDQGHRTTILSALVWFGLADNLALDHLPH